MVSKTKIEISTKLIDKIKRRLKDTEFNTVEEYIEFILNEVLNDYSYEDKDDVEEDEKKIKERLKALGYLG
jgi:hypothetical protein